MSATGRGAKYDSLGRYYTPDLLAEAIVRQLPIRAGQNVDERHVGKGAWMKALALSPFAAQIHVSVSDIDPAAPGLDCAHYGWAEMPFGSWHAAVADFCTHQPAQDPHWILGNPPYAVNGPVLIPCSKCGGSGRIGKSRRKKTCSRCDGTGERYPSVPAAEKHVRRALKLVEPTRGSVVYLLRSAFTESITRGVKSPDYDIPFWTQFPARHRWDLAERPSYDGKGTDSCAYSAFWWDLSWLDAGNGTGDSTWEVLSWKAKK